MNQRAAILGLVVLAGLAWLLPRGVRVAGELLRPRAASIYAAADSGRLYWSPGLGEGGTQGRDGRVVGPEGTPLGLVGGWEGLLLGNPLDLNQATQVDLEALPGIGPKTAAAIRSERSRRAGFQSVADLLAVKGVGRATLERLRPLLWVGDRGALPPQGGELE